VDQAPSDALVLLSQLGVALVRLDPDQVQGLVSLRAAAPSVRSAVLADALALPDSSLVPAPEEAPTDDPSRLSYLQGYRDATLNLARVAGTPAARDVVEAQGDGPPTEYQDDANGTWGLHATGVLQSGYTGKEVRVAALTDGLDTTHPDWTGRTVAMQSFVPHEPPAGGGDSGTHYLGTVLGTHGPSTGPRYGCAPDAVPYVAKVWSSRGAAGSLLSVYAALEWAVNQRCRIILVPLGWGGPGHDAPFEAVAQRVVARGSLLIAGVGHNARRGEGNYGYAVNPAACPSVMGIGSIDRRLRLPAWTPRSAVILTAPGVELRSSVPHPSLYRTFSGSATAAAYTAGIATLWAEAQPEASPRELWQAVVAHARPLLLPSADVGAGLVQAPASAL
jgi:hypothetical protein